MIDDVFAALADTTRRQILIALTAGSRPVGDLVNELGVSQPTVSKHLKVLRRVGLVDVQASGQKRYYYLTPKPLEDIQAWVQKLSLVSVQSLAQEASAEKDASQQENQKATERPEEKALVGAGAIATVSTQLTDSESRITFIQDGQDQALLSQQAGQSYQSLDFTPLAPFVPDGFALKEPVSEFDAAAVNLPYGSLVFEESAVSETFAVEGQAAGLEISEELPRQADETQETGKHSSVAAAEDQTSLSLSQEIRERKIELGLETDEGSIAFQPQTDSSAQETKESAGTTSQDLNGLAAYEYEGYDADKDVGKGFLASITRWGRRRSR